MESEGLTGERFLCFSGEYLWMEEIVKIVKYEFEKYGYKVEANVFEKHSSKDEVNIFNFR